MNITLYHDDDDDLWRWVVLSGGQMAGRGSAKTFTAALSVATAAALRCARHHGLTG